MPLHFQPFAVETAELLCHIPHRGLNPGAGLLPFATAQTVQDRAVFPRRADIPGNQLQLGHRNIQHIGAAVFDFDIVLDNAGGFNPVNPVKLTDSVGGMYDIIPHL